MAEGEVSLEMEKVFRNMPSGEESAHDIRAKKILEINADHKIYARMKTLFETNKDELSEIAIILLNIAKLIEGLPVEDMERFASLVSKHMV